MYELNNDRSGNSEPPDRELILKSVECESTLAGEGQTDKISLKVNNKTVWDSPSIRAGDKNDLSCVSPRQFYESIDIELVTTDTNMSLGSTSLYQIERTSFTFNDSPPANYELRYWIKLLRKQEPKP